MFLNVNFALYILILFLLTNVTGFHHKLDSLLSVNLLNKNYSTTVLFTLFNVPQIEEKIRLLEINEFSNFLTLGARNKIINLSLKESQIQQSKTDFVYQNNLRPKSNNCTRDCDSYAMMLIPILDDKQFNKFICGSLYGHFRCIKAFQNMHSGIFEYFSHEPNIQSSKYLDNTMNNVFYFSLNQEKKEHVLYMASSWSENSQFLSAYNSRNDYQQTSSFKKIGENNGKLFLFQNEKSFEIDDGERERDIVISNSLVTQFCKNDENILNDERPAFYTDLTAKIYCFNKAFKSNSGNFKLFKFDSLEYVSDLIRIEVNKKSFKNLFYGVFNTPKNQITGTAICVFDIGDFSNVFQNNNFRESIYDSKISNPENFSPQSCPNLTRSEKLSYERITSKLGFMKKAVLPVQKRKASFILTHEFRISTITVLDRNHDIFPTIKKIPQFEYNNVILAGTNDGKLLRMVHFFSQDFFKNQRKEEENLVVIEDVQLFTSISINEIRIFKSKSKIKIIAIADNQVKIISSDFCEFHKSCEDCLKANQKRRDLLNEQCFWSNKCHSKPANVDQSRQSECYNYKNSTQYNIIVQNVSHSQLEKVNPNFSSTSSEIKPNNIVRRNLILCVISVIISVFLIVTAFLIIKKIRIQFLKELFSREQKESTKKKFEDNSKNSTDYFENIYSIVDTKKRVQNVYHSNKKACKTGSESQNKNKIFQIDYNSPDLIFTQDFYEISFSDLLDELQQRKIKDYSQQRVVATNKRNDSISNSKRRNFAIVTEDEEIYFEDS